MAITDENGSLAAIPMIVAAAEQAPDAVESLAAAAVDPVRWEFRLTADRRRILVQVNPTTNPEEVV